MRSGTVKYRFRANGLLLCIYSLFIVETQWYSWFVVRNLLVSEKKIASLSRRHFSYLLFVKKKTVSYHVRQLSSFAFRNY